MENFRAFYNNTGAIMPVTVIICTWRLTLYVPRLLTTHGRDASLPSDTVTFGMGSAKFGSSVNTETHNKHGRNLIKRVLF